MEDYFFVSDIHGKLHRYEQLYKAVSEYKPKALFLGGDLLPHGLHRSVHENFTQEVLIRNFLELKESLGEDYPEVFVILGNDDPRSEEKVFTSAEELGIWKYIHNKIVQFDNRNIFGYAFVPPTPFRYKDWEKYDVSRYVDPGCIGPLDGIRTIFDEDIEYSTIEKDLKKLTEGHDLRNSIFLFHSPPYKTHLDRAGLDGLTVEHVPVDVHVGSIAIMRFIEENQPAITMHGHIHESSRITGHWWQQINATFSFSAAWDGPELALVKFDPANPQKSSRMLL